MVFVWRRRSRKSSKKNSSKDQTRDITLQNQANQIELQPNQVLQTVDEYQASSMHEIEHHSNFPDYDNKVFRTKDHAPPPYVSEDLTKISQEKNKREG